ncbi:MAG: hypothetical protein U0670_14130 [Anaerolineae bacterium]
MSEQSLTFRVERWFLTGIDRRVCLRGSRRNGGVKAITIRPCCLGLREHGIKDHVPRWQRLTPDPARFAQAP